MKICGSKEDVESPVQGDWKCGQGTAGHRGTGRKVWCRAWYWASAWQRYWRHLPLHTYSPAQFRTGPGPGHIDVLRTADSGGNKNRESKLLDILCGGIPVLGTCKKETNREPLLLNNTCNISTEGRRGLVLEFVGILWGKIGGGIEVEL